MHSKITKGKKVAPQRVVIYGPEGVGKSSFAAGLKNPLFLDAERSTQELDVARWEIETVDDLREALKFLREDEHDFKTVVIDTIDWYEGMMADELVDTWRGNDGQKADSIEQVEGGWGRGLTMLAEKMSRFLCALNKLSQERGLHIALLAHSHVRPFTDPALASAYDRYEMKLSKKSSPRVKEWADAILFYNFETKLADQKGGFEKKRAVGGKNRGVHTSHAAAFDAKNRHGLDKFIQVPEAGVVPEVFFEKVFRELGEKVIYDNSANGGSKMVEKVRNRHTEWVELAEIIEQAGGEVAVQAFVEAKNEAWPLSDTFRKQILARPEDFVKAVKGGAK